MKRNKGRTIIILLAIFLLPSCKKSLEFSLLFSDAKGIKSGDRVLFRGVEIGEVAGTGIDPESGLAKVDIRIFPEFSRSLKNGMVFTIKGDDPERYVDVEDTGTGGEEILRGEKIRGKDSLPTAALDKLKRFIEPFTDRDSEKWKTFKEKLEKFTEDLKEEVEKLKESDKFKRFLDNLSKMRKSLERRGERDLHELKEKMDEVEKGLSEFERELKKESKEKAEELKKKIRELKEEMEERFGD